MNQLSWLLYIASVCGNAATLLQIVSVFSGITVGILVFAVFVCGMEGYETRGYKYYFWWVVPIFVVSLFGVILVPDKNTIYAIAASQMGEQALKTPLAQKAEQAVMAWMDEEIVKAKQSSKEDGS